MSRHQWVHPLAFTHWARCSPGQPKALGTPASLIGANNSILQRLIQSHTWFFKSSGETHAAT